MMIDPDSIQTVEECDLMLGKIKEHRKKLLLSDRLESGMKLTKDNRPNIEKMGRPSADVSLEEIVKLRLQGDTYEKIAKKLKVGVATIYRRLSKETKQMLKDSWDGGSEYKKRAWSKRMKEIEKINKEGEVWGDE